MATSMSNLSWLQGWNNPGIHPQTSLQMVILGEDQEAFQFERAAHLL